MARLTAKREELVKELADVHGKDVAELAEAFGKSLSFIKILWPALESSSSPAEAHNRLKVICTEYSQDMLGRLVAAYKLNEEQTKLAADRARIMTDELIKVLDAEEPKIQVVNTGPTVQ